MTKPAFVREAVCALREGFGMDVTRVHWRTPEADVYVDGIDEPIIVKRDDVIVPEALKSAAAGIRLDIQAILANH